MRKEEDQHTKKSMDLIPRGKRSRGRQRKKWKQGVEESISRREKEMDTVIENKSMKIEGWRSITWMSSS